MSVHFYLLVYSSNSKTNILHCKLPFGTWTRRWQTGLSGLWHLEHLLQGTSEMEWWNPCGQPYNGLSDINPVLSHTCAQKWNIWKVSSCLSLWSQFRIANNAYGKCVLTFQVHSNTWGWVFVSFYKKSWALKEEVTIFSYASIISILTRCYTKKYVHWVIMLYFSMLLQLILEFTFGFVYR